MADSAANAKERAKRRKKRKIKLWIRRIIALLVALAIVFFAVFAVVKIIGGGIKLVKKWFGGNETEAVASTDEPTEEPTEPSTEEIDQNKLAFTTEARRLMASYRYNDALELIDKYTGYKNDPEVQALRQSVIDEYNSCIPVDMEKVPHVFVHSLIVDTSKAFVGGTSSSTANGVNAWMITIEEYKKVLDQLYANGYVLLNVSDLYTVTGGTVAPNTGIKLPEGKKALVFSYDDLAYYAQYSGLGFGEKIVKDADGKLKVEYTSDSGEVLVGDYDWLPILDAFVEEHPDFSYQGHKGTIAMTGYDGCFGYRTDIGFFQEPTFGERAWLNAHPDITVDHIDEYIEQAKEIAQAIKEDGYEFASHSWGHRRYGSISTPDLEVDMGLFFERVTPIIGETEILIYAHGDDIAGSRLYNKETNSNYAYLLGAGYKAFCNVDASWLSWYQYNGECMRGARIDIDGYTLYTEMTQGGTVIGELGLNAAEIFDPIRPTPVIAET